MLVVVVVVGEEEEKAPSALTLGEANFKDEVIIYSLFDSSSFFYRNTQKG